ncbi:hypothetical protein [Clostridium sp. CF012]|nr:hypothetical protein [Clostridium sp. CF012]MBU3146744.1 hypothetical protein [Clostridium sp. CF012]
MKKRFAKSLANKAPSKFLEILDNKLKAIGCGTCVIAAYDQKEFDRL